MRGEPAVPASGPLVGVRVVELAGLGPAPFCAMVLGDYGADVLRVDRLPDPAPAEPPLDPPLYGGPDTDDRELCNRSRRSVAIDLKHPDGVATVLRLVESADVLIEGFRPGVAERLGLGPDVCLDRNPRIVYGRMTGWGQDGPLARSAGHDVNYLALSGALHPIGRGDEAPVPPLNLLADFGGGGMLLALGICAALVEAKVSGRGQVVDAAMVDGVALLSTMIHGFVAKGVWTDDGRGTNPPPSLAAPFYDVYETADHRFVSIATVEPAFYGQLLALTGLDADPDFQRPLDRSRWPAMKEKVARLIATRTRDEWCAVMEGTDACFAPVLTLTEAPSHPHNVARGTFVDVDGVVQPAPAPRFSRTPAAVQSGPALAGQHTVEALLDWGLSEEHVAELDRRGVLYRRP